VNEYENKDLVRRRFYLSKELLKQLDAKAKQKGVSGSLYLEQLLKEVYTR